MEPVFLTYLSINPDIEHDYRLFILSRSYSRFFSSDSYPVSRGRCYVRHLLQGDWYYSQLSPER